MGLVVIPNVLGICTWSPRLDEEGNSWQGKRFCELLSERFAVHNYATPHSPKLHLGVLHCTYQTKYVDHFCTAAKGNDLKAMTWLLGQYGTATLPKGDYDFRTALHLAATEGHADMVEYLAGVYAANGFDKHPKD